MAGCGYLLANNSSSQVNDYKNQVGFTFLIFVFNLFLKFQAMKKLILLSLTIFFAYVSFSQNYPFPQHISYAGTHIKPGNYTQKELDKIVTDFYYNWRTKYLKNSCGANQYFISFNDGKTCVSEGQGYGMMIFPLMAGYDFNAQSYFDGLYRYYKAHPSNINSNLMAWKQVDCVDEDGADAASDGDIDIAYGLLLAHAQWGSSGDINYLQEAYNIIGAIMKDEINQETWTVKLGDWTSSGDNYYYSTRTSDFIIDHFRVFKCAGNDNSWEKVVESCYSLIEDMQNNYSSSTGLLPDFIIDVNTTPKPASPNFLEGDNDGNYYYNACRDPWRLTTDYLLFADERAKTAVNKINTWLMNKTANAPSEIKSGYKLNGTEIATWDDPAFVGPFAVGAMLDINNQQWLDDIFEKLLAYKFEDNDYYSNTIKLLNLLVISGNYWSPDCDDLVLGFNDLKINNESFTITVLHNVLKVEKNAANVAGIIVDMKGNILKTVFLSKRISKFDLSDLPEGCYILKLNTKIPVVKKFMLW